MNWPITQIINQLLKSKEIENASLKIRLSGAFTNSWPNTYILLDLSSFETPLSASSLFACLLYVLPRLRNNKRSLRG